MDDETIVGLYWTRQESAIAESERKYGNYCRAIADNILHSREDSEECVSDTWLHAWNAIPPKRPAVLSAFLGKITRNLALDCWKLQHAEKRGGGSVALALDELAECIPSGGGLERVLDEKELSSTLDAFLRTLPERECSMFLRRYWFVDGIEAIALRFSVKPNTVKSILFRTREKLRAYLQQEGICV